MSSRTDELKLDIDELNLLLQQAKRQKCKDLLSLEVRNLQTELSKLEEAAKTSECKASAVAPADKTSKCYEVKLNNYAWSESDKFVKIYVTLKNVQTLPEGAVSCNFSEKSIDLKALGLENRNYHLPIHNLCEEIDTTKSYFKVKTDMIVVFLAKKVPKQWSHVTGVEKRIKEAKIAPPPDMDKGESMEGIMNLVKKMYHDGDDNMKKVIAKAWTESQNQRTDASPSFPSL